MDSRLAVGVAFMLLISVLLFGSYAALTPTRLDVTVYNKSTSLRDVTVVLSKDGQALKSWTASVPHDKPQRMDFALDIGKYVLTVSSQGLTNLSVSFDIPFDFFNKAHSEVFSVAAYGIFHGNVY
jgi:hypothetical protein